MSSNRLTLTTKAPAKSFFTMVELIAVISITAILLTITIRIMKTDSTKANAQVIGSALSYAQAYALSKLDARDDLGDGFDDEYVMVIIDKDEMKVTIKKFDTVLAAEEVIREEKLAGGSNITDSTGNTPTSFLIGFRSKGDPITVTSLPSPVTDEPDPTDLTTLSSQMTVTITDKKNSATKQTVRVKPFTGKVTYY